MIISTRAHCSTPTDSCMNGNQRTGRRPAVYRFTAGSGGKSAGSAPVPRAQPMMFVLRRVRREGDIRSRQRPQGWCHSGTRNPARRLITTPWYARKMTAIISAASWRGVVRMPRLTISVVAPAGG